MWYIQRTINPFELMEGVKFASFVGGGGKTSLIERLAASCLARGRTVAITTTTKIFAHEPCGLYDDYRTGPRSASFARIGKTAENGKLTALGFEEVRSLGNDFDVVLIEADGAKGQPIKYPADHEPVIAPFSDKIFIIAGLDALFKPFGQTVFRHELFRRKTGIEPPRLVYPDIFLRFFSDDALLKGTAGLPRTVVLNKYDSLAHRHIAAVLLEKILHQTGIAEGFIASVKHGVFYRMERE